jgi:aryl carrier-like protein
MMQLYIREQLARVLQIDAPRINVFEPLLNLGLDSLMALEMRNRVRNEFGVDVPFAQIVQGLSTAGLASLILEDLGLGSPTASQGDEASLQALELESAVLRG